MACLMHIWVLCALLGPLLRSEGFLPHQYHLSLRDRADAMAALYTVMAERRT